MSRLDYSHQQTTTTTTSALPSTERKLANKQRRQAGREVNYTPSLPFPRNLIGIIIYPSQRHEERKNQLKALEWDRKQERLDRDSQRQEKRPDDGARAFAGRNLDNHRVTVVSYLHLYPVATEGWDRKYEEEDEEEEQQQQQPAQEQDRAFVPNATSGAALLAMARPARVHRGGRNRLRRGDYHPSLSMTDGERFEIVEIDGRLVALDEDGWEILPDENAEASLLYSEIVRGDVR